MSGSEQPTVGSVTWRDLTVDDAERTRDFYSAVVGWTAEMIEMAGYSDFSMATPVSGETVAGICHARGVNQDLPAQWLIYITVEDLERSLSSCRELGGKVIVEPRELAGGRFGVIRDPAGATCALFQASGE